MALIKCGECSREMSSDATACPACGKPNTVAAKKAQNSKQNLGCLLILLAFPAFLVLGPFAAVLFILGLVLVLLNTRVA